MFSASETREPYNKAFLISVPYTKTEESQIVPNSAIDSVREGFKKAINILKDYNCKSTTD